MAKTIEVPFKYVECRHCHGDGNVRKADGLAIRAIREKAGWGLRRMADRLSISVAYLSDMELGRRNMSVDIAKEIIRIANGG